MDSTGARPEAPPVAMRHGLWIIVLAPILPQLLGSAFNILYNQRLIHPLLVAEAHQQRFFGTVVLYNSLVYPAVLALWAGIILSLRRPYAGLLRGAPPPRSALVSAQRRVLNLPWYAAAATGTGWLLCIPVFLVSLATVPGELDARIYWHLPVSFLISAAIAVTQGVFLVEILGQRILYGVFFRDDRPRDVPGASTLSVRGRGLLWAISAGVCPIVSVLLLLFSPQADLADVRVFAVAVGGIGIAFGILTALMLSRLVGEPLDRLRVTAEAVGAGDLGVSVPLVRADELGTLIDAFNDMVGELREKRRLREMFGLHVGRAAARQILAGNPGLGGKEEVVTVLFIDIRGFTRLAEQRSAEETVALLNDFLSVMVDVVEGEAGGMVNKFLGDGFMAIFGAGGTRSDHADAALQAACAMQRQLAVLNRRLQGRGQPALEIGIGLHTGPAVVGSIGSPRRMEYTVIGGAVNLASRVEGLTKELGETVLLTRATRDALRDRSGVEVLCSRQVRGVADPVEIHRLVQRCPDPATHEGP